MSQAWVSPLLMYVQWLQVQSLPLLTADERRLLSCLSMIKSDEIIPIFLPHMQLYSLVPAVGANQMLQRAPCVAFHELLGQLLILSSNGVQQWCHLRLHLRPEAVETVEIEEQMEVRHRLRKIFCQSIKLRASLILPLRTPAEWSVACIYAASRSPASVHRSDDSQPGTDVRGLEMCKVEPTVTTSARRPANIRPAAVGRASAPHCRTDP